jgi:localization factor PodJL
MEEHVLRHNGGAAANADEEITAAKGASKLPPATVGPFSLRLAAAQGDASAQFEVASRLAEGKGTDQDLKEAALWYRRAAANGFAMAQFRLGTLYERGLGVKADPQRAQVWYERAAAQGNVKAMHNLAVLAASRSPKGDYEGAARWFKAAADHGLADSQYNLAVLYENGLGVTKDMQQAYKWLLLAAKSGDKDAAGRLDALKPKLAAGDLATAESAAAEWQAKPVKGLSNDARVAGQVWRDGNRRG